MHSGCGDLDDVVLEALPFTRSEVEAVTTAWQASSSDSVIVCLGPMASEERFRLDAPGKQVLHLATHGFLLDGSCPSNNGQQPFSKGNTTAENPLLLSGLFFAGANRHGAGADSVGAEDGVLTAYEVSAMDLRTVDLVVLSACETGLGKVKNGEGVYGLRRSFQLAGARRVISALWSVPDEFTATMMAQLYSASETPLPERMRDIQLKQIESLRRDGLPDHPFLWAGFILLGDWR